MTSYFPHCPDGNGGGVARGPGGLDQTEEDVEEDEEEVEQITGPITLVMVRFAKLMVDVHELELNGSGMTVTTADAEVIVWVVAGRGTQTEGVCRGTTFAKLVAVGSRAARRGSPVVCLWVPPPPCGRLRCAISMRTTSPIVTPTENISA